MLVIEVLIRPPRSATRLPRAPYMIDEVVEKYWFAPDPRAISVLFEMWRSQYSHVVRHPASGESPEVVEIGELGAVPLRPAKLERLSSERA